MAKTLEYPFAASRVKELKVGDRVSISGRVFMGRDRLHKYLFEGGKIPVDLKDGAIYHCGPVMVREGGSWNVVAAGPTTSIREEPYMSRVIEKFHVRVIIGKGGMGDLTRKACAKHGCIYVQAVGGAAVLLGEKITSVAGGYFMKEFGLAEALWDINVTGLEGVVTMDARGRSLHKRILSQSAKVYRSALTS